MICLYTHIMLKHYNQQLHYKLKCLKISHNDYELVLISQLEI